MSTDARYEVILVPAEVSPTSSEWTWRRIEQDATLSASGSRHGALNDCFAEVRDHARQFGKAPVTVNLRGEDAPASSSAVAPLPSRTAPIAARLAPKALLRRRSALRG